MRVTTIVPVYNEEKTIGNVLRVLASHDKLNDIIVVGDGSTDNTRKILRQFKVKVVRLNKNIGKGGAVRIATKKIESEVILFIDADLIGLKKEHIGNLLEPIMKGNSEMVIGLRDKGNAIANRIMPYFPLTGGERVTKLL